MDFQLTELLPSDLPAFKKDMQEAFQLGAAAEFADLNEEILPERDIDRSLAAPGSAAWKALADGETAGGAIVVIEQDGRRGHLDFLYVKHGAQSRGLGQLIWAAIEEKYPRVELWETVTPYFEKRNIHFYINRCGFAAVEFFNPHHRDPQEPGDRTAPDDMPGGDYFFRFEKDMRR